jgi:hypothetical protein
VVAANEDMPDDTLLDFRRRLLRDPAFAKPYTGRNVRLHEALHQIYGRVVAEIEKRGLKIEDSGAL